MQINDAGNLLGNLGRFLTALRKMADSFGITSTELTSHFSEDNWGTDGAEGNTLIRSIIKLVRGTHVLVERTPLQIVMSLPMNATAEARQQALASIKSPDDLLSVAIASQTDSIAVDAVVALAEAGEQQRLMQLVYASQGNQDAREEAVRHLETVRLLSVLRDPACQELWDTAIENLHPDYFAEAALLSNLPTTPRIKLAQAAQDHGVRFGRLDDILYAQTVLELLEPGKHIMYDPKTREKVRDEATAES